MQEGGYINHLTEATASAGNVTRLALLESIAQGGVKYAVPVFCFCVFGNAGSEFRVRDYYDLHLYIRELYFFMWLILIIIYVPRGFSGAGSVFLFIFAIIYY